ncbi:MAG: glycosyltransferase family 9 protein [Acidobacteriota bacterium]
MRDYRGASLLAIRLSSMGDIARLLPALAVLGRETGRVDLTVEDRFTPLLELFPVVSGVIAYPRRSQASPARHPVRWGRAMAEYLHRLRQSRYDLALDLHGILRSALVGRASGAMAVAGYAKGFGKEHSHLLYDHTLQPGPEIRISRFDRYSGALRALGFSEPEPVFLEPAVPEAAQREVDEFLESRGLPRGRFLFAFLGTSRAQGRKRWPPFRYLELAREVRDRLGKPTLLGWGPEEAELIDSLPPQEGLVVIPDWGLDRLVAVIRRAGAFVGADTGAMHISALLGVPTVAVLGPTDPVVNRPFGHRHRVVHRMGVRRACAGEACVHRDCMGAVTAGEVLSALEDLWAGPGGPPGRTEGGP